MTRVALVTVCGRDAKRLRGTPQFFFLRRASAVASQVARSRVTSARAITLTPVERGTVSAQRRAWCRRLATDRHRCRSSKRLMGHARTPKRLKHAHITATLSTIAGVDNADRVIQFSPCRRRLSSICRRSYSSTDGSRKGIRRSTRSSRTSRSCRRCDHASTARSPAPLLRTPVWWDNVSRAVARSRSDHFTVPRRAPRVPCATRMDASRRQEGRQPDGGSATTAPSCRARPRPLRSSPPTHANSHVGLSPLSLVVVRRRPP